MLRPLSNVFTNPNYRPTAIRVALCVGTILFTINHGHALISGNMTPQRWISGILTYCVPYTVSLHGQHQGSGQRLKRK